MSLRQSSRLHFQGGSIAYPTNNKTGLVYDKSLADFGHPWNPNFSENGKRITETFEFCETLGLTERCVNVPSRNATENEIFSHHTPQYFEELKSTENATEDELLHLSIKHGQHFDNLCYSASKLAAGSAIGLTNMILSGDLHNGMAIIRPPGHHASHDKADGYCFLNNVVLCAKNAIQKFKLSKILIVDFDVHHGQGVQRAFYDSKEVLYISIHRYEFGHFWPSLRESDFDYIGKKDGTGFNINIPLNTTGLGDSEFAAIFFQIILPVCLSFKPEMTFVCAGFDACMGDSEGLMEVSPNFYPHMLHMLKSVTTNGKLCVLLEGGYCIKSMKNAVALSLKELLGDPLPHLEPLNAPHPSVCASILNVIKTIRPYWPFVQFQGEHDPPAMEVDSFAAIRRVVNFEDDYDYTVKWTKEEDTGLQSAQWYVDAERLVTQYLDAHVSFDSSYNEPSKRRSSVVYDEAMMNHKPPSRLCHPEVPQRISGIKEEMDKAGLWPKFKQVLSRRATKEELLLIHSEALFNEIELTSQMTDARALAWSDKKDSLYATSQSFGVAKLAVGSLLSIVDSVCSGETSNGVAIIRPPGHHSEPDTPGGFCFFDNVAVAARYAQHKYPAIKKIMIIDWDVHHGNGIQKAFETDKSVLYVSLHRYDNGAFYPGGSAGNYTQFGKPPALGFNVNIAWNATWMGYPEYLAAFHQIVLPIGFEFQPDLVFVSAGFDAALGDPLGNCCLTPQAYAHMTHLLLGLAGGKLIMALEGGYNVKAISESMTACAKVMVGDPLPILNEAKVLGMSTKPGSGDNNGEPHPSAVQSILNTLSVHANFWKSLAPFRVSLPIVQKPFVKVVSKPPKKVPTSAKKSTPKSASGQSKRVASAGTPSTSRIVKPGAIVSSEVDALADRLATTVIQASGSGDVDALADRLASNVISCAAGDTTLLIAGKTPPHQNGGLSSNKTQDTSPLSSQQQHTADTNDMPRLSLSLKTDGDKSVSPTLADLNHNSNNNTDDERKKKKNEKTKPRNGSNPQSLCQSEDQPFFAVNVLPTCHHVSADSCKPISSSTDPSAVSFKCSQCPENLETWICLGCHQINCSRFVRSHAVKHFDKWNHPLALSIYDLSVWCYVCEAYINPDEAIPTKNLVYQVKFGSQRSSTSRAVHPDDALVTPTSPLAVVPPCPEDAQRAAERLADACNVPLPPKTDPNDSKDSEK